MKLTKIFVIASIAALMVFSSCKLEEPSITSSADVDLSAETSALFASYVSLGNSLTAGYQSGALTERHQKNSYVKMIATQAGVGEAFMQPLMGYPGIGTYTAQGAGIMELQGFDATGNPIINPVPYAMVPSFNPANPYLTADVMNYPAPYSNLGIPGIVLADLSMAISSANSPSHSGLIDPILRNPNLGNTTPIQQALLRMPTMITCWIGNNDVLGYATSGGTSPAAPTDVPTFTALYGGMVTSLTANGADLVVANIPYVTSIPFFTTVPFAVDPGTGTAIALVIQATDGIRQATAADMVLLTAKSIIGDASGTYGPAGVPVGFDASAPLPTPFVLDAAEVAIANAAVDNFNGVIANAGVPVVDANALMASLADGHVVSGIEADASFLTGGAFSLDGVHPNDFGSAVLANEFINTINENFDTNIPPVNVTDFIKPAMAKVGKSAAMDNSLYLAIPEIFGGKIK